MSKHTPGPWAATPCLDVGRYGPPWTIRVDKQTVVASLIGAALHRGAETAEANARLIAAAPDLLAALKELLPMWESGIREPWVERARAAIAKAEGR